MIAFEIDNQTLRIAVGHTATRQFRVTHVFAIDVAETDQLTGQALQAELQARSIIKSDAIAVLNRWQAEIREITVPPAPENELPQLVRFQARNEFVSLGDDWPLDFLPLEWAAEGQPQRIFAAAAAPQLMERLTAIAEAAGVKLKNVVLRPLSLLDLLATDFEQNGDHDAVGRLIIGSTGDHAELSIAQNDQLTATRLIRFPADATPEKRASMLTSEARRTLASAKSLSKVDVEQVLIVGDPKRYRSLTGDLKNRLKLDVKFVDPFELTPQASHLDTGDRSAAFAGLLGSLVRDASDKPHAIDFLSPRKTVVLRPDRTRWYTFGGLALAASLFFMLLGWWTLSNQWQQMETLSEKLSTARSNNEGTANRPSVDQIVAEVGVIDQWKLNDINWLTELKSLSDRLLTPDDVIIDTMIASVGRSEPVIDLSSRVASVAKETEILESLDGRPYRVTPERSVEDPSDSDYPLSLDFQASFANDLNALVLKMNQQAAKFMQQQNSPPAQPIETTPEN